MRLEPGETNERRCGGMGGRGNGQTGREKMKLVVNLEGVSGFAS